MTSSKLDEELRKAAVRGDVDFLKNCVESNKPINFYKTFYPEEDDQSGKDNCGNIFHMATMENQEEFIREAMGILPQEAKQQLLVQPGNEIIKWNPLHVAAYVGNVEIVKIFLDVYRCLPTFPSHLLEHERPWLLKNSDGNNPCFVAVFKFQEECALEIYKMDTELISNMPSSRGSSLVFEAVHSKMSKLALEILRSSHPISCNGNNGFTPFHSIHFIEGSEESEEIFRGLLQREPELIKKINKNDGSSAFHLWAYNGKIWPFKILLDCKDIIQDVNKIFTYLVSSANNYGGNPLHILAEYAPCTEDATKIAELLIDIYKKESPSLSNNQHPWLVKDKFGDTPLSFAIAHKNEKLAIYLLSVDENVVIESKKNVLFLAVEVQCHTVAKKILKIIDNKGWTELLMNHQKLNILHLAPLCTDEEFGTWLVNEAPEFITEQDNNKQSPWDTAYETGTAWFIKAVLKKDPSVFYRAPLAWIKACEHGHVSALRAFIDHNPAGFRDLCIKHKNTPLHHMKLSSLSEYEELLTIPRMKDLINVQNSQGKTPLHLAVQNRILPLTETLLGMEKIAYNIKDEDQNTPIDLLEQACKDDSEWEEMCQRIGFNPWIKTSYFQRRTNLLEVRNSLFVVAALLATITFTAGFTLPGGLNQESGEALLAKKVAFLVFLMSNTLAMCTSMLVLICLVWSMVQDSSNSLLLIDRSMVLLLVAFYSTILAFMTGVYVVIYPKVLWAAIIIVIMCSLIGVSANRTLLYKVLLISSAKKKQNQRDPMYLLELGKAFPCCEGSSSQKVE